MNHAKVTKLIGMRIVGQHGREIGVVADISANVITWKLETLEVKLNRATLDELKLKKPWLGTQSVRVPVSQISGATDNLVLTTALEEMEFEGGQSADPSLSAIDIPLRSDALGEESK